MTKKNETDLNRFSLPVGIVTWPNLHTNCVNSFKEKPHRVACSEYSKKDFQQKLRGKYILRSPKTIRNVKTFFVFPEGFNTFRRAQSFLPNSLFCPCLQFVEDLLCLFLILNASLPLFHIQCVHASVCSHECVSKWLASTLLRPPCSRYSPPPDSSHSPAPDYKKSEDAHQLSF